MLSHPYLDVKCAQSATRGNYRRSQQRREYSHIAYFFAKPLIPIAQWLLLVLLLRAAVAWSTLAPLSVVAHYKLNYSFIY